MNNLRFLFQKQNLEFERYEDTRFVYNEEIDYTKMGIGAMLLWSFSMILYHKTMFKYNRSGKMYAMYGMLNFMSSCLIAEFFLIDPMIEVIDKNNTRESSHQQYLYDMETQCEYK